MANYEDLKKKAKETFETLVDVSAEAYKIAEEKAKILARKAILNAEITREKALIRRLKGVIGNKYYELHKDDPEEAFKMECESITDSFARIGVKRQELDDLKNPTATCDCGDDCDCAEAEADAETVADATPEATTEAESAPEAPQASEAPQENNAYNQENMAE